jgi:hypothetical protein
MRSVGVQLTASSGVLVTAGKARRVKCIREGGTGILGDDQRGGDSRSLLEVLLCT